MNYINSSLVKDEKLIFETKYHWIILLLPIIICLIGIILFLSLEEKRIFINDGNLISIFRKDSPNRFVFYNFIVLIILTIGFFKLFTSYKVYKSSEFGITNKRAMMKSGFLKIITVDMFLNKIEGIQLQQDFLGRVFNFGSLIIIGTGGTKNLFPNISFPLEFKKFVEEQLYLEQTNK